MGGGGSAGGDGEVGHEGDGGESLPAEPKGADALQVLELPQLGRGVPLAHQRQIRHLRMRHPPISWV